MDLWIKFCIKKRLIITNIFVILFLILLLSQNFSLKAFYALLRIINNKYTLDLLGAFDQAFLLIPLVSSEP
jgi:hypothetical protein